MPQSLAQLYVHLIFSTKNRVPLLDDEWRGELHSYMAKVLQEIECPPILINSVRDHVHILGRLSKNRAGCEMVESAKKHTSKWIKTKGPGLRQFQWQSGYGLFSVSPSRVGAVQRYVQGQAAHHRRVSFQDEFRRFLKEYGIEYDEQYVWD